jgi:uncharacterized protein (TIGR02302 family)
MGERQPDVQLEIAPGEAQARLARRLAQARAVLAWEQTWPALWPLLALAGVFLVVALLDVLPHLEAWLHACVLAIFAAAAAIVAWRSLRTLRWPDETHARRRLETASGFSHRPLSALQDRLAAGDGDPASAALWAAYRRRLAAALGRVKVGWPRPNLAARDPIALRALIGLMVVAAFAIGGGSAGERLARAFTPGVKVAMAPPGVLDLWITPPAYTGIAPLVPRPENTAELLVPAGSTLLAQVSGGRGAPKLVIDAKPTGFEAIDAKSFRLSTRIDGGTELRVEQNGKPIGAWKMRVVPDAAPTVKFAQQPSRTRRSALRVDFEAEDDYGLASVTARVKRAETPAGVADETIDLPLTLPAPNAREGKGTGFHDLTAHPWAGLKARLHLQAVDSAGQSGVSESVEIVLPERLFQNPVARAIIEQRKILVADPLAQRQNVARALAAIAGLPGQYQEDTVVFLALRFAGLRLMAQDGDRKESVDGVQSLMWDTALRIEDGRLSLAERELRALQQRLQDAIANRESDEEIERLIRELQQAIDRYLQAMIENALRNPQDPRNQRPMDRNAQRLERMDLQKMLDQARQMARTGARDQAREMLQRLQEMLENLRAGNPMQAQPGEGEGEGEGSPQQQMMQSLQEMMQRQQQLTDRTFRRSQQQQRPGQRGQQGQQGQQGQRGQQGQQGQQGQSGQPGGEGMEGDIAEQEALRQQLGEMMRQLAEGMNGRIPNGFGRAERAMREALDQMQRGQGQRALRPQMDALDQMRQGARELMQQLTEQMAQQQGEGAGEPGQGDQPGEADQTTQARDPAGRPLNNGLNGVNSSDVNIPAETELQRSREILEELLRRAGERYRPQLERDYIERLLRRF